MSCIKGKLSTSGPFTGYPMNVSRKSVEEMNTDMSKDDRAMWPDRFLQLSLFYGPFHCLISLTLGYQHSCKSEIRPGGESLHQQAGSKIEGQAEDSGFTKKEDSDGVHQKIEWRNYRREVENNILRLSKAQFSTSFSEVVIDMYISGED
ncbi:uncharacterized protein LOC144246223 isoform X1 [Lonchura striata]